MGLVVILQMMLKMQVLEFKKGFNADVIEYVSDFVKPINKPMYSLYTILKKLKRLN